METNKFPGLPLSVCRLTPWLAYTCSYISYMSPDDALSNLLAYAEPAFLTYGYEGTNLALIAAQAGISKKTIYKLVASKSELFAGVVRQAISAENFSGLLEIDDDIEFERPLRAFLKAYACFSLTKRSIEARRLVVAEARKFPELARVFKDSVDCSATLPLIRWIEKYAMCGRLNVVSPSRSARILVAMVIAEPMGHMTLGLCEDFTEYQVEEIVNEAVDIFLYGSCNINECCISVT